MFYLFNNFLCSTHSLYTVIYYYRAAKVRAIAKARPVAKKSTRTTASKVKKTRQVKKPTLKTPPPKRASKKKSASKKPAAKKAAKVPSNGVPKCFQGYTPQEYKKYCEGNVKFSEMTINQLKEYLKLNHQSRSGNKGTYSLNCWLIPIGVLVMKCNDGYTLGSTPKCNVCGGGFLRFNQETGFYKCPGYRDDEDYVHCKQIFTRSEIKRGEWETPS